MSVTAIKFSFMLKTQFDMIGNETPFGASAPPPSKWRSKHKAGSIPGEEKISRNRARGVMENDDNYDVQRNSTGIPH